MIYLDSLHISSYKQLRDFRLDFQKEGERLEWLTVLFGINGSGKTTVLECLTLIFRGLHEKYALRKRGVTVPFDFTLTYSIGPTVVTALAEEKVVEFMPTPVQVVGKKLNEKKYSLDLSISVGSMGGHELVPYLDREEIIELIPNVVVYYSGLSETLSLIYQSYENRYLRELKRTAKTDDAAYSRVKRFPLFYLRHRDIGLLTAALVSSPENADLINFFTNILQVTPTKKSCVHLRFRGHSTLAELIEKSGEDYLGYFFRELAKRKSGESYDFIGGTVLEFSLVVWNKLREEFGTEEDLFTLLLMLRSQGDLRDITVYFDSMHTSAIAIPHQGLSEGEQQMLTIRALSELLVRENTLLLFDEPDTFLHPQWQQEFFDALAPLADRASCLLTTHSSVLLAHLKAGNLVHLQSGDAQPMAGSAYGQRYADTLTDYMGLGSRPPQQETAVEKVFTLLEDEDVNVAAVEKALKELRELVGADDPDVQRAETLLAFWEN
jgi:ABC-type branched-subunit amino acid transport system ATPase component